MLNVFLGALTLCSFLGYEGVLLASPRLEENISAYNPDLEQEITNQLLENLSIKVQQQPILILIGGFQGSGKSSLIARINEVYDNAVISTDVIRQSLFNKGLTSSPLFSKYVSNISYNLLEKSLINCSNIIIDANAHSKRIEEIEKLLKESDSHYTVMKIFLNATENTLIERVRTRQPLQDCYQGTESDLKAALAATKINLADYDLILDTDQLDEKSVFELVNFLVSPYFSLQSSHLKNSVLSPLLMKNADFFSFVETAINKNKDTLLECAKIDPSFQQTWKTRHLEIEHHVITTLDREILEPRRRPFQMGIDRSPEHLPCAYNQFKLQKGDLVSASKICLSAIDPSCPDMIAAQGPMPGTITRFWSMVVESNSHVLVMLTDLVEKNKVKCTRYWPENMGETLLLEGYGEVSLISNQLISKHDEEELWHAKLQLAAGGIVRPVHHYWLKGWKDGKALNSLELQEILLEHIHQNIKNHPEAPPIIHCSAGVGRTGTIMGCYLAKHLLAWSPHKKIIADKESPLFQRLPFEITLYLRHQRSHLLHTLDQYRGLHRFIHFLKIDSETLNGKVFPFPAIINNSSKTCRSVFS